MHQGVLICPECGARQRRHISSTRCANCHGRVPQGLTVCPHCGRDARSAGPRWALWLALAAVLAIGGLWGLGKLPLDRIGETVRNVRSNISGLVQVFGPASSGSAAEAPTATPQALAQITAPPPTAVPSPTDSAAVPVETAPVEPMAAPTSADALPAPTETPAPTATPTALPTATATLAPTPTPLPPTPTAQPARPTATRPAGGTTTYRVQSGDTLSTIAAKFGITWEALAAANGLTARSVLQIGQMLVIPIPGAARPPTATPRPAAPATPTPQPPEPTPAPFLAAPTLANPGDQAPFSGGDAFIELKWDQVPGFATGMQYQITIRWAEQGAPQEHRWFTTAISTRVPLWLWGRADQPVRQYTWFVTAVQVTTDGKGGERVIPLSPPSVSRVFYWN